MKEEFLGLINRIVWKRATEIYKKWELIQNKKEIRDITALTRYPYLIKEKFRTQEFNNEGYYKMILFIDGV